MKSSWTETSFRVLFSILILLFGATIGFADDVGITKARLIQETEKSYVLEADVTQVLVWAINSPRSTWKTDEPWNWRTVAAHRRMWTRLNCCRSTG